MAKKFKALLTYVFIIIIVSNNNNYIVAFIMVLLHEYMHYITACRFGIYCGKIKILPFGAVLKLSNIDILTTEEKNIVLLSGPIMNLVLAVIFYIITLWCKANIISTIAITNLSLGIFNLIPAIPLDGGNILKEMLCTRFIYRKAEAITISISLFIGGGFMLYYIYCFFRGYTSLTLGIIALYIIFYSIKEKERIPYIVMSHIINKKIKLIRKGYIENKNISVHLNMELLKVLSLVEKNKYDVFTVVDDELKVIGTVYEGDIVDGLKIYGNISLKQYLELKNS